MRDRAFYHYSIDGFETNKDNAALVDIFYGAGRKCPLQIFKKDAKRFINAIISKEEREKRLIGPLVGDEVEVLNSLLKGRAMILCTDLKNYYEYINCGQNGIKEIAGLRIDGEINLREAFDYENLEPSIKDLYPNG